MNFRDRHPRSFTLVELLTVVAIMGVLAGTAAVSLRGLRSPALASAANEVASALKSTRQMAIASGRRTFFVIPISNNPFTTNLFRSYAIFEEVPVGEASRNPPFATNNNAPSAEILCEAITEWRLIPEGAVFCNLAAGSYSATLGDPMPADAELGQLQPRLTQQASGKDEWKYFESSTNFSPRKPGDLASLGGA